MVYSLAISSKNIFAGTREGGVFRAKISDLITSIENTELNDIHSFASPNPCSESTVINYQLSDPGNVKIDIYNSLGEKITTLVDEWQEAGRHNFELGILN